MLNVLLSYYVIAHEKTVIDINDSCTLRLTNTLYVLVSMMCMELSGGGGDQKRRES